MSFASVDDHGLPTRAAIVHMSSKDPTRSAPGEPSTAAT